MTPATCPHCHADITPRYNFCTDCGTLLVEYAPAIAGTVPAGFGIRLTALMIDSLVLGLVNLALIYCFAPDGPEGLSRSDWLPPITARFKMYYSGPWWLCLAAWSKDTLYFTVAVSLWSTTVGKRALGLHVLRANGDRVGWRRALARDIAQYLSLFCLAIPYLLIVIRPDKRGLHDLLCETVVVARVVRQSIHPDHTDQGDRA